MGDRVKKTMISKNAIIVLLIITFVAVGVTVWAVFFRQSAATPTDYAPQQVDKEAEPIGGGGGDDGDDKLEQPVGGGAVSLTYAKEVALDLNTSVAGILFQNPSKSNQDMALQLAIDGKVIAQSDKLPVGYKLSKLTDVDTEKLSVGTYEGKFIILYYDADTGEKAIVNTEIPVTITVS